MVAEGLNSTKLIVKRVLIALAITLATLHAISTVLSQSYDSPFFRWFDMDGEHNVPAIYTALLLGCCAFLCLLLIAKTKNLAERFRWIILSMLFFYLAFDEALIIHESFALPLRNLLSIQDGSFLYHAWVIPGLAITLMIVIGVILIRSRRSISRLQKTVMLYIAILAACVISLEIIGTQLYFSNVIYKLGPVFLEEMIEISLISLILYKLTSGLIESK